MIHETSSVIIHPGNSSSTEGYRIPFRFDGTDWLEVARLGATQVDDGDGQPLEAGMDFTVEEKGDAAFLTTRLPVDPYQRLRIRRRTPLTQTLDLDARTSLPAPDLELALDRLTMALQDRREDASISPQALTFPAREADAGGATILPPHDGSDEENRRSGTTMTFRLPEDPEPGKLQYVETSGILEEIRTLANSSYLGQACTLKNEEMGRHATVLDDDLKAYELHLGNFIVNNHHGTTFGYWGEGHHSNYRSLIIHPDNADPSTANQEESGPQTPRSIVIGYKAISEGDYLDETEVPAQSPDAESFAYKGDALLIGSGATAGSQPNGHFAVLSVGCNSMIYGYANTTLGAGSVNSAEVPAGDAYMMPGDANNGQIRSTIIGADSKVVGLENFLIGGGALAYGKQQSVMGSSAVAKGFDQVVMGAGAKVDIVPSDELVEKTGDKSRQAIAVGSGADSYGRYSISAGPSASARAEERAFAMGSRAAALEEGAVALGENAKAQGAGSVVPANGTSGGGATASTGLGWCPQIHAAECVEIQCTALPDVSLGARAQLHPHHGLCLSYAATALPPERTTESYGAEPATVTAEHHGTLADGMMTFHCDGNSLFLHLAAPGGVHTAVIALETV